MAKYAIYTRRTDILEYNVEANSPEEAKKLLQDYIDGDYEEIGEQPEPDFVGVSDEYPEIITEVIPEVIPA